MYFKELLHRTNLDVIESFILTGDTKIQREVQHSYSERIKEASKKATAFFEAQYTDIQEYDRIVGFFFEQTAVYQEVYFELGLIAGSKMAFDLRGKIEDLK
jgi:hypothetical protein